MFVLLDANVISELLRPSPNPVVEIWVAERPVVELYFSAIGEAELRYGVGHRGNRPLDGGMNRTTKASAWVQIR